MMKRFTLIFAAALFCAPALWSQVTTTSNATTVDSLEGFRLDPAIAAHEGHDPAEYQNMVRIAQRDFIDQKYELGRYAPGYVPPNLDQKHYNPVAPVAACTNVDFETGDFTGWSGAIGQNNVNSFGPLSNITPGIFSTTINAAVNDANARHTIVTSAFGNDPMGNFPVVPPIGGGTYAVRLGGRTPNYQGEILEQTFTVNAASTSFAYQYACVLNSGGHPATQQPYFKIEVLDQNGQPISSCTQLYVAAGTSSVNPGFYVSPSDPSTYYKPWTAVNFDLTGYVNQDVTIRFTVAGCTQSGHYGYAYIDCSCSALAASVNFCPGNTTIILTAPTGYGGYQWLDPTGTAIPGATNDTLLVTNPTVGDTFFVYLTSVADTSCHNTLPVVLLYTDIVANASSTDATCWGVQDGTLSASGTVGIPPYTYSWNTNPVSTTANVNNVGAGTYIVTMQDSLGCEDIDTVYITEPPRIDTSLFSYDFCPGDPNITLYAPPGYTYYTWMDPNGDTIAGNSNYIIISGPQIGAEYSCILWSPPACPIYDSIILNMSPPTYFFMPDTTVNVFTPNGDLKNDYFYPYYDQTVSGQNASTGGGQPAYNFDYLYVGYYEIWVYNRWGQEVFYSNDYTIGWDGKIDSKDAPAGVYFWVAKMTSRCKEDQTPVEQKGFVHLIR